MSIAAPEEPAEAPVAAAQLRRPAITVDADRIEELQDRAQRISRAARRVTIEEKPVAKGHRFTTVALHVRVAPDLEARSVTVLDFATRVAITGETRGDWAEVIHRGRAYWVAAEYLARKKPEPEEAAGASLTGVTCDNGSTPPSGVTAAAMRVYHEVCVNFPSITSYGGWRADGEHSDGRAVDIMVSGELGWQVAEFLLANASELGLYDIIYSQRIWTDARSAEGWRPMEDRGSATANHYDHVHVKVY